MGSGEYREKLVQSVSVQLPAWRELEKDRSKPRSQSLDQGDELFVSTFRIGQFLVVRNITARFDRKTELAGCFTTPGLKS